MLWCSRIGETRKGKGSMGTRVRALRGGGTGGRVHRIRGCGRTGTREAGKVRCFDSAGC